MIDIMGMIKSVFDVTTSIFNRIMGIEKEINTPEIKANVEAKDVTKNTEDNKKAVLEADKTGDVSEIAKRAGIILFTCFLLIGMGGCAQTYVPTISHSQQASFDGNVQNSGIIGTFMKGGFIVTEKVYVKYNALIKVYGSKFNPVLKQDDGIFYVEGNVFRIKNPKTHTIDLIKLDNSKKYYLMDDEAMTNFLDMKDWENSGIQPPTIVDKIIKSVL